MPSDGTDRPRDRATRERILRAAEILAIRKGYSGTTMAAISRQAGVHPGSVYWYFKDKDAVFAAAIREFYARESEVRELDERPFDRVLRIMTDAIESERRLGQWRFNALLLLDPVFENTKSRQAFVEVRRKTKARLIEHWIARLPGGAPHSLPADLASTALAIVDGALLAAASGDDVDLNWLARAIVDMMDATVAAAWKQAERRS